MGMPQIVISETGSSGFGVKVSSLLLMACETKDLSSLRQVFSRWDRSLSLLDSSLNETKD